METKWPSPDRCYGGRSGCSQRICGGQSPCCTSAAAGRFVSCWWKATLLRECRHATVPVRLRGLHRFQMDCIPAAPPHGHLKKKLVILINALNMHTHMCTKTHSHSPTPPHTHTNANVQMDTYRPTHTYAHTCM